MKDFEIRANKVFDIAIYLQLMGSFVPNADFNQIKELVLCISDFLKGTSEQEIELRLPMLKHTLEKMANPFIEKYPPKKEISEIATEWNSLFKDGYNVFSYGLNYGWLSKLMDLKNLHIYDHVPYHFKIGLVAHKGFYGIEEEFLLKDSFNALIKAEYYFELLNKYGEKAKRIELEQNKFKKETYTQITDLKFEVAAYSRLTVVSFYAFVESFVNSVGYSYLQYNIDKLSEDEREFLSGLKKGRYLQLQSKMEKFQKIIRPDKKCVLNLTDNKQISKPFKSFFDYYEDLRNASVHFSPSKERIWMKPQDWLDKSQDFSKISITVGFDFWKACFPDSDGPQYLGKLDFDLHYQEAKARQNKIIKLEREINSK